MSRLVMSFRDYNREGSAVSLRLDGYPATELGVGAFISDTNALVTAINNVSLGLHTKTSRVWDEESLAAPTAAASDINSQRERKWLVRFYDNDTFKTGSFEIPMADLSLLQTNSDYMDIESGAGAALVSALEANMVSGEGNEITIVEVVHVGRNT